MHIDKNPKKLIHMDTCASTRRIELENRASPNLLRLHTLCVDCVAWLWWTIEADT